MIVEVTIHATPGGTWRWGPPSGAEVDHIEVTFDETNLVANARLFLVATLVVRLRLEKSA